jgi:DNA-binding MarR family transcriptional regulator
MHKKITSVLDAHQKYWPETYYDQLLPLRFALFYAQLEHHTRAAKVIACSGLSVVEFDVLATLRRSPPPHVLTPSEIQHLMLISSGGLTKVLMELERKGFVSRTCHECDRRIKPVILTESALPLLDGIMRELESEFKDWVNKSLTTEEVDQLTNFLMRLIGNSD